MANVLERDGVDLEAEFFAVEGAPVDYAPAIAALEAAKTELEVRIAELRGLQEMGGGRKPPRGVQGLEGLERGDEA